MSRIGPGLRCMNPYEMLRREKARFILSPRGAGNPWFPPVPVHRGVDH